MAVVGPAAYRPAGLAEDVRLLCDSLNCIAYAFALPLGGPPRLDWLVGSISGTVVAPIKCLMDGELGTQTDLVRSHLEAAVAGNASQIELIWRDGSSGLLHLRDAVQPEFDNQGRVVRIVGTVRDVADELWSSRESAFALWQHRIVEHLDQGLACWDREGRLVLANRQFRTLGGACLMTMRPGASIEALARAAAFSGEIVVDGPPEEWIAMVLEDFGEGRYREHRLADGRSLEAIPIRVAEGTILRIHDVSSQKGGERALRDAKEIAETANLKKSRFLRAANHDLRQPLATLKILIYSSIEVQDAAHRLELLHSMDVTVSIMEEILGSLLQIGQLDAGRMTTRIVHFQMSQLMERLKIEFAPQATSKGLTFRVIGCHATVESDRALLERILGNFIANAIRFTEAGCILVGARRRGKMLDIEVWDTGCGIPADQLELIFEEFHQVGAQPTQRQRGLGLGLNIAYRVAELLGHRLGVRSKVGKGSVFSVSVPLGNVWQSDIGEPEISERVGGEFLGINVLVIEDNELLRQTICLLLERWGVLVFEASDGVRAVALVEDGLVPDLVLADYRLPHELSGMDVLARLRTLVRPDLPGIIATADTEPELIARIRQDGVPVLIKPISPARLRSAMHHLLYEQRRDPITDERR